MAGTPIITAGTPFSISVSDSTTTVANVATGTNSFYVLNNNATTSPLKIGVFKSYADATAMTFTDGQGIYQSPNTSELIIGNFGINPNPGTVYVAAVNQTMAGGTTIYVTPVAP